MPQSQASLREGKTFHCKVHSKLYRNSELHVLVNFTLILSAFKRSKLSQLKSRMFKTFFYLVVTNLEKQKNSRLLNKKLVAITLVYLVRNWFQVSKYWSKWSKTNFYTWLYSNESCIRFTWINDKNNNVHKTKRKEKMLMLCFTISNLESARTQAVCFRATQRQNSLIPFFTPKHTFFTSNNVIFNSNKHTHCFKTF